MNPTEALSNTKPTEGAVPAPEAAAWLRNPAKAERTTATYAELLGAEPAWEGREQDVPEWDTEEADDDNT